MEVKINKEIRDYTESVYFGLSLRQFIFSIAACVVAVLLYFVFKYDSCYEMSLQFFIIKEYPPIPTLKIFLKIKSN